MLTKQRLILIAITSFFINGCANLSPTIVRNGGTETTQANGVTTASMRHQSCFQSGNKVICSDANGNQVMHKDSGLFTAPVTVNTNSRETQYHKGKSQGEIAIDVGVQAFPYVKGLINLVK